MRKIALILVLVLVVPALSADLPATTEAVVEGLLKFGFKYVGLEGNALVYRARGAAARVKVGSDGRITEAGVVFSADADTETIAGALALYYYALQADMGKPRYKDPISTISLKMKRLLDAVSHNLKINNSTKFEFDDLQVIGLKLQAEKAVALVFRPYLR